MASVQVDALLKGFPGRTDVAGLSWASVALIRTEEKNILVDTAAYAARRYLLEALEKHGLKPSDIDMVLLTHLHQDHTAGIDLFPQALFVFSRKEWEYANLTAELQVQKACLSQLHAYRRRLIEQDGEEIMSGITALFTPGHTPGGTSYVCDVSGEKWVIAGDAVKNRAELAAKEVEMTTDPEASLASINRILEIADRVLPGHDTWLKLENGSVIPMGENIVRIKFQDGITVNGQNPLILKVD